jgi:glutaminyl-tRNA synthetase
VRLRYAYIIRCDEVIRNEAGEVIELRCTYDTETRGGTAQEGRQVKGTIHWVSKKHGIPCEVRLYDRLFRTADPESDENVDFRSNLNPESLVVIKDAVIEPSVENDEFDGRYQFERLGYFALDPDSRHGPRVYNRTVTLRDTWAKVSGAVKTSDGRPDRTKPHATPAQQASRPAAIAVRSATLELKRRHLEEKLGIAAEQADILTRDDAVSAWFEDALTAGASPVATAKWLVNDVPRDARERIGALPVNGAAIGRLIKLLEDGDISANAARDVLTEMLENGGDAAEIVERRGLRRSVMKHRSPLPSRM